MGSAGELGVLRGRKRHCWISEMQKGRWTTQKCSCPRKRAWGREAVRTSRGTRRSTPLLERVPLHPGRRQICSSSSPEEPCWLLQPSWAAWLAKVCKVCVPSRERSAVKRKTRSVRAPREIHENAMRRKISVRTPVRATDKSSTITTLHHSARSGLSFAMPGLLDLPVEVSSFLFYSCRPFADRRPPHSSSSRSTSTRSPPPSRASADTSKRRSPGRVLLGQQSGSGSSMVLPAVQQTAQGRA